MKKRILSTFLTFALLLTLLPTAVMAEGNRTIYTQTGAAAGDGSSANPYGHFEDALAAAKAGDTIVIREKSTLSEKENAPGIPCVIDKAITIQGENSNAALNVRTAGIVLGADVILKNLELNFENKYHHAIFANGHHLTSENVTRGNGSREVQLFAGSIGTTAGLNFTATAGTDAKFTLKNSVFGNIYAGGVAAGYTGAVSVAVEKGKVGTIYGSGADDRAPDGNWFDTTEPPAPTANPTQYPVTGTVRVTLTNPPGNLTVDGSGANDLAVDVSTDYSTTMALPNAKKLNVTSGTVALSNHSPELAVTLTGANTAIDLSKSAGEKTIASLSGGGTVMVGVDSALTIGSVDSSHTLATLSDNGTPVAATRGHGYIVQNGGSGSFTLDQRCSVNGSISLTRENNTWKASEQAQAPTALDTLTIASGYETVTVSKDVINGNGAEVKVNFAPVTASLSNMEITFALNGKTAKWDRPNGDADAIIDNMLLSASDNSLNNDVADGVGYFLVERLGDSEIAAGSYHFEVTTPKANTNEQLKVSFTLTVTDGEGNKPQPPAPEKNLTGIAITTPPTKTAYTVGDVFNPAGMVVTATYSNGSTAEVSGYTTSPTGLLTRSDTSITVSYTEGGVTKTAAQIISVTGKDVTTDMFDFNALALTYTGSDQINAIKGSVALKTDYTDKVGVTTVTVVQNGATVAEAINAGEYEVYVSCTEGTEYDALVKTKLGTVTIGKAIYGDRAAAGAAKAGTSGTVDLSGKLVDGSITNLSITNGENILDGTPTISGKALTFKIAPSATTGSTATVEIKVTNANYDPYAIAVTLTVSDKTVPPVTPPTAMSNLVYNGQEQALITAGTVPEGCKMLYKVGTGAGDFTETVPTGKNAGNYVVSYKVVGNDEYADVAQTTLPWVAIARKKVTIRPQSFTITKDNAIPEFKLEFVGLVNGDTLTPSKTPTFRCLKELTSTEEVTNSSVPGQYPIQWINSNDIDFNDGTNYQLSKETIGKLTIQARPSGESSSGGGSSSGGSSSSGGGSSSDRDNSGSTGKVETTTKPDGTKVQTETKRDGTKVETTTAKDGSTSKTTTNPNGSSVTENKAADGSTGTVKTDKSGQTTAETQLSSKAVETAKKNGEPVKAPVEVEATRNSNTAPVVNIEVPKSAGETKVEIPVTNVKPGTVAVLVHPDGTEEIIKNSVPTEDGIQLTVNGGATVKIVDNSKDFIDTRNHWAKDEINFVASRELFKGVTEEHFGVERTMTRAMVSTVLARLAGVDTTPAAGQNWYDKGIAWARENGVSDGSNPNGNVTREQLAAMLYRYAGSPAVSGSLPFSDAGGVSDYAQNALIWATQNGILNGYADGRVMPAANSQRSQVAAMMARFIQNAQ